MTAFPRRREPEWMDADGTDPAELRRSLDFIERVNRRLGYTRATIGHLDRLARRWPAGRPLRVLDVATGSADVPRAVCVWADRRGGDVRVVGVDRHPETLAAARERTADGRIELLQADALALPFAEGSFDVAICSMFLHHLSDDDAVRAVRELRRASAGAVIVADLLRSRRALAWITLFTAFSNPMVKHDARASVRQAFTSEEAMRMASAAGLRRPAVYRHFGHRFVLTDGEAVV